MELICYDAACHALAECTRVDEAKDIVDKAAALQAYARQAKNPELERLAAEIRLRAKRKVGEISKKMEKSASGRAAVSLPSDGKSKTDALRAAGLSISDAHRWDITSKREALEIVQPSNTSVTKLEMLKIANLNIRQRAMVAAKIVTLPKGANQHASIDAPSQDHAADMLNVSKPSVERTDYAEDAQICAPVKQDAGRQQRPFVN